jgi:hypothetical protein
MATKSKKEEAMSTELTKQEDQKQIAEMAKAFGGPVSTTDVLIPKILLMQSLSDFVVDDKAAAGDLVDSVSGEVVAGKGKHLEVIPISMYKTVVIERNNGSKWEYVRTQPYKSGDEKNLWEFTENGERLRGNVTLNFFVLRADQVDQPDALPYAAAFRRTSKKAGQYIATHFMKASMAGKPPMSKTILIGSKSEKGDQGPYHVFTAATGRDTAMPEMKAAFRWVEMVKQGLTKVDESDEKSGGAEAAGGSHIGF